MPHLFPPRREPRVLAVSATPRGFAFAVVDPWHVRTVDTVCCAPRARRLALRRVIRREKPTALVAEGKLCALTRRLARELELGYVEDHVPRLPRDEVQAAYPEIQRLALSPSRSSALALVISAVLHAPHIPRRYAPRRHLASRRAA